MIKLFKTTLTITLLVFLLSIAFHSGKRAGFRTGSEWAIFQATIVAREAGMALPVYLHNGAFRVVLKQPPGLYQRAWHLANKSDQESKTREGEKREDARNEVVGF